MPEEPTRPHHPHSHAHNLSTGDVINTVVYSPEAVEGMVEIGGTMTQASVEAIAQTPDVAAAIVETTAEGLETAIETFADIGEVFVVTGEFAAAVIEAVAGILAALGDLAP